MIVIILVSIRRSKLKNDVSLIVLVMVKVIISMMGIIATLYGPKIMTKIKIKIRDFGWFLLIMGYRRLGHLGLIILV